MNAGVPVALATDDEGVSRSDMTHEYLRGAEDQYLSYSDLKRMARTSLEHAFVAGGSLWSDSKSFAPVKECAGIQSGAAPSSGCQKYLATSEKARLQLKLEQQFREFEAQQMAGYSWKLSGNSALIVVCLRVTVGFVQDNGVGSKLRQHLTASAAWRAALVIAVDDRDGLDADALRQLSFRNGAEHGRPFGAIREAVGGVLHVAAADDFALAGEQRRADIEV